MKTPSVRYNLFYFVVLIGVASIIPSLPFLQDTSLSIFATSLDVQRYFGLTDPAKFAHAGWLFFTKDWASVVNSGVIDLWPPGFVVLQALILKCFGANAPLVLIIQILAASILAITFNLFRIVLDLLSKNILPFLSILFPLSFLFFSQFRFFMLGREGVMLGETFSISFLLIGIFCIFLTLFENKKSYTIWAGIVFALSAYFRSQFETFFIIASVVLVCFFLFFTMSKSLFRVKQPLMVLLITLLIFHGLTLPYRIYTYKRDGSLIWVKTSVLLIRNNFFSTSYLLQNGGSFVFNGAGNVACRVDEERCSTITPRIINNSISNVELRRVFIETLLKHPIKWISFKLQVVPKYWFASIQKYWDFAEANNSSYFEGIIFLISFISSIFITLVRLRNIFYLIIFFFNACICLMYGVIFIAAHFEVRYLFLFKFYFYVIALLGLSDINASKLTPLRLAKKQ